MSSLSAFVTDPLFSIVALILTYEVTDPLFSIVALILTYEVVIQVARGR